MSPPSDGTLHLSRAGFDRWLKQRVAERSPAAVVRFGDGERSVLEARSGDRESMALAAGKLAKQVEPFPMDDLVLEVKEAVCSAFDGADVLGIVHGSKLAEGHANWFVTEYFARVASRRRSPACLADCMLHHGIVKALPELLPGRRVSTISCREVKPVLEAKWHLRDVVAYQVPSQRSARHLDGAYEQALHGSAIWPYIEEQLQRKLEVREEGEVFLIGAGIPGKHLCVRIREMGGLALDLGSGMDRIVGKVTRGPQFTARQLHAQDMSLTDIAAYLEDRHGMKVDLERLEQLVADPPPPWFGHPFDPAGLRAPGHSTHPR